MRYAALFFAFACTFAFTVWALFLLFARLVFITLPAFERAPPRN